MAPSGNNPDLIVRVAANIAALQTDMAAAAASVKSIEGAVVSANTASQGWAGSLNDLGHSWVLRIAEGELLRDAVREVLETMKELAAYFPELAMRGAVVGDVEESFKHLASSAGLVSAELLGTLRAGVHGTVDDFELMKRTNKDLAAGLNLTEDQFGLLSQGAFALAKATGGTTAEALDKMSDALVKAKAKGIEALVGKVDLKAAEDAYAATVGGTGAQLDAESKLEADRTALLAAVASGLARVGDQQDSLKDKVDQGRVSWANFEDDLGKTIAQSPVLAAGLDSVKASLLAAFGGDQKALIESIASAVVNAAIVAVDFGIGVATMAGTVVQVWYGIKTAVLAVETVIVGLVTAVGEVLLAADKMAGKLHLVDDTEVAKMQATQDALRGITVGLAEETAEAARGAAGHSALGETLTKGTGILLTMRDSMIAAQVAQDAQTASTTAFVGPVQAATVAVREHVAVLKEDVAAAKRFNDAWAELASTGDTVADTMATINPKILEQIQYYIAAGASVHTLAAAYPELTTAQVESVAKWDIATKATALELTKVTDDYYKTVNAASHDSVQRQIDDAYLTADARIAAMYKAKTYSIDAEMMIWKAAEQTADNIIQKTLESDVHSKAHFVKIADDARIAYEFATAHADNYTQEWITQLQKTADAAKVAADTFGTSFDGALSKVDAHITATIGAFHQLEMASAIGKIGAGDGVPDSMEKRLSQLAAQQAQNPSVFVNPIGLMNGLVGHADGIRNAAQGHWAMVGEKGPEPMYVPQGASIFPTGTNVGGGATNITINVTQPLGTPAAIAAAVDHALISRQKNTGARY